MRLLALFMLLGFCSVHAASHGQEAVVDLRMSGATLSEVFQQIERQTDYMFVYKIEDVRAVDRVDVNVSHAMVKDVLASCLQGTGLVYVFRDNVIVIQRADDEKPEVEKALTVKGWVQDEKKLPMPGVTVRVVGTSVGTATNEKGWFSIDLPISKGKLEFSFVGYKKQQVDFTEKTDTLRITMEEDAVDIDEVVVTGIFNKPKESFTGAVTAVTKEDLKVHYSRNIIQTLANIDPSLRIVQNNEMGSDPNTLPELRLRGTSTMLSIDELQAANSGDAVTDYNRPLFIMDGFEVDLERVMDMNENEIENITILKDASATSLYGSRGANGVIVITTTRFTSGALRVMYQGRINLQIPDLSTYDNLMTAEEKFEYEKEIGIWDSELYKEWYDEIEKNIADGVNYDWTKVPTRTGVGQYHILQVSGGQENWNYSLDLSYQSILGSIKESDRKNFNGTISLGYRNTKWNVWQSLSVASTNSQNSPYGDFSAYVAMNRYWEPYDENGEPIDYYYHPASAYYPIDNPLYDKSKGVWNKTRYVNLRSNTRVKYTFMEGFTAEATLGLTRRDQNGDSYYPPSHKNFEAVSELDQKGSFRRGERDIFEWQVRGVVNYTKTFCEKHMFTSGFSVEFNESTEDYMNWSARGFAADNIDHPGMSLSYPENSHVMGEKTKTRRAGFSVMLNYYYDSRYFVDGSFTYNGSSSFGSKSRFSPYYSVGAGWEVGNERFVQDNLPFVTQLKLRYSFGVVGNSSLTPSEYMEVFSRNSQDLYLNGVCWTLANFANPYLEQQNSFQHNAGFNMLLFNSRLQIDFNYYNFLTDNTLTDINLPVSHGFESIRGNMGKLRNEGFEWYVRLALLDNKERELRWYVNANITRQRNTIVELTDAFKEVLETMFTGAISNASEAILYQEGKSLDAIYGLYSLGIDPVSGQRVYRTHDGYSTLEQNADDLVYLGDSQPKFNTTFNTTFSWKGLGITLGFLAKWGGKQVNFTELNKGENVGLATNLDRRVTKYGWKRIGDNALYKNQWGETSRDITTPINSDFVHKDNVFSCTNVNISYQVPGDWLKRHTGLESLSVSADLSDLFYLSTIERERGTAYPFSINPNFSISVSF